ncbi:hypothetical protein [Comamonas aquatica]|uniref:hypothetical protein n=1 Tax=Comamonas aquatica TaxID=225991 RepID=UPI0024487B0E|nr:hypothetical protein [Comamonas aquatica]MDH1677195.1 hypothetical protein [Comamonas aquatica]
MNVDQQVEQTAFEQAFAQASGQPAPAAPAAEAVTEPQGEANPDAQAPTTQATVTEQAEATNPDGATAPAGEGAPAAEEDDPVVLEGFKRSEVKRLLAEATKVQDLAQQLRKAQGKIGELNSKLQSAPATAQPATPTQQAPELPPELKQFEQDFPEIAAYAKALIPQQQQTQQAAPPAHVQQTVATDAAPAMAELDPVAIELAVMDRMHKGWREKVQGQEFALWLAAQPEDVQMAVGSADTADALAGAIGLFDQWTAAKAAQAQKAHRGQQRLAAAVTPQGNAPKPQAALTEEQAFEAGFNSIMGQR